VQGGTLRLPAPLLAAALALLGGLAQPFALDQGEPSIQLAVSRFNTIAPPAYRAFRRLEGGLTGSSRQGWLEAWTEFIPGRGFTYEVVREGGHEYVRNKVLRNLLSSEQDLITRGVPLRALLVPKNYDFGDGGVTESGLHRVVLKPVRKSDGIINGTLLMDPAAGSLVRLEGRLLKSPSFWVRDVDVTWKYVNLGGHDLPVEMISSGRVRLFGRSTFKMAYEYVTIDGRPISEDMKATLRESRQ
jgi:hypothetical protein